MLLELFNRCIQADYIHKPNGVDYAIEIEGNTLYILFEYSDDKEDWRVNFKFFPIPWKPYKNMQNGIWFCHRGFLGFWKSIRDEIRATVDNLLRDNPNIKSIKCVGYSHGGGLSILATEDMSYYFSAIVDVAGYGFASPRVVWGFMNKSLKKRLANYYVIRNIPDLVTHVPPMFLGFRNGGKLVRIGKSGKYAPIKAHYSSAYINELKIYESEDF